jgi:hypothetical protein
LLRIHHEDNSRLSCPMNSCSKTFTCQASIYRHLTRCHSPDDIIEQINTKQKQTNNRQYNIQSLLSGFDSRKLNQENEIAQQMKSLFKLLNCDDCFLFFCYFFFFVLVLIGDFSIEICYYFFVDILKEYQWPKKNRYVFK